MEASTYYETEVYADTHQVVPIQDPTAWETAEQQLNAILEYRSVKWGDSFLIRREIRHIQLKGDTSPSIIFHDYMLRNNGNTWKREIAVWKKRSRREYDIDMRELHPQVHAPQVVA
jgi:hypothetical protein